MPTRQSMKSLKTSLEHRRDDFGTPINKDVATSYKKKNQKKKSSKEKKKSKSSTGENHSYGALGKYHDENQFLVSCINPLSTSSLHLGASPPHLTPEAPPSIFQIS
eukprot:Gb_27438 [translate_table: standard]